MILPYLQNVANLDDGAKTHPQALYRDYQAFCREQGAIPATRDEFDAAIEALQGQTPVLVIEDSDGRALLFEGIAPRESLATARAA